MHKNGIQFTRRDFARPAAGQNPVPRGGKREFEIGDRAGIRIGRRQQIGVPVEHCGAQGLSRHGRHGSVVGHR